MTAVRFDTMGASRSYLDFFMGFGWSISVAMAAYVAAGQPAFHLSMAPNALAA